MTDQTLLFWHIWLCLLGASALWGRSPLSLQKWTICWRKRLFNFNSITEKAIKVSFRFKMEIRSKWRGWLELVGKNESAIFVIKIRNWIDLANGWIVANIDNGIIQWRIRTDVRLDGMRGLWSIKKWKVEVTWSTVFVKDTIAIMRPFMHKYFACFKTFKLLILKLNGKFWIVK